MTLTVKFTTAYKKSYKRMKKRGLDLSLLDDVVEVLRHGETLDPRYRDHELKGNFYVGNRTITDAKNEQRRHKHYGIKRSHEQTQIRPLLYRRTRVEGTA